MKDVGAIAVYDKDPTITGKPWDGTEEDKPRGYNTAATGYELTDGQIHTKSIRPQWCNATVKQRLAIPGKRPAQVEGEIQECGDPARRALLLGRILGGSGHHGPPLRELPH